MSSSPRKVTPSKPDLVGNPRPAAREHPLGRAFNGIDVPNKKYLDPHPKKVDSVTSSVLETALRYAEALITHPLCLRRAACLFVGNDHPNELVMAAICHIFASERFVVGLTLMGRSKFALHRRPDIDEHGHDTYVHERTIQVNSWYIRRLVQAIQDKDINPDGLDRQMFFTTVTLAHELIHVSRRLIHFMLRKFGVSIPYDSPPRSEFDIKPEAGWDFENWLFGGVLEAVWILQDDQAQSNPDASTDPPLDENGEVDFDQLLSPTPQKIYKEDSFDFLVVDRPNGKFPLSDKWISQAIRLMEKNEFHTVSWPPAVEDTAIPTGEIATVTNRDHKPADIIRYHKNH